MTATSQPAGEEGSPLSRRRQVGGWLFAALGTVALTLVLVPFRDGPTPTFEAMLYLALSVGCALVGGRWPALGAAVIGFFTLNFFFTEPLHSFTVANGLSLLTLAVFVVVSVAVSAVVDAAARREEQATRARADANTLALLNTRILAGTEDVPDLLRLATETFGARSADILPADTTVAPGSTAVRLPPDSVLVLEGATLGDADARILAAFATHLAVLREREELHRQTAAAHELEVGNRTRTALIAAVSHDLRTPLTGVRAAAETLRRADDRLSTTDRDELLKAIEEGAERLTTIIADLLDMSRLQTGVVAPVFARVPVEYVLDRVLDNLPERDRVTVHGILPAVKADAALLERVLENVVANALRHAQGLVEISGTVTSPTARVLVADHGPGVPAEERQHIFEPFQRLGDQHRREGVGLGLAVARGLTEAQGGTLRAEETPGGGLTMVVELTTR